MSGFGGGFGSSQQQPSFGAQQRSSSQPDFGGGFASTPGGFGQAPAAPPSFGDEGFGSTVPASPFGGSAPCQAPSFGTSSNIAPFGQTTSGFGSQTPGFASSANIVSTPSFGNTSNTSAFPAGQGNQQSQFATDAQQPFGTTAPAPLSSFGGTAQSTSTFGGQPFGGTSAPTFGQANSTSSPFGQAPSSTTVSSSPFGNAPGSSSTISFGVSANVIPSSTSSGATGGFGSSSSTFPQSFQNTTTFAASPAAPTFGATSDNEDMGGAGDFSTMTSSTQPQFGNPQQSSWSGGNDWRAGQRGGALSPLPEQSTSVADSRTMSPPRGSFSPPVPDPPSAKETESEEEKLARLKAKLQEKKKKLEQQKKRKEAAASAARGSRATPPPESAALNPNAAPFSPSEVSSLAERNKRRFAAPKVRSSQLPDDLKGKAQDKSGDDGDNVREHLTKAVSLVGTCRNMCPDDELLRREREGDIQLLEIPQPGTIHPENWTLRETAVKRFRRSAADFKLDVPEWVRPPAVLERVCAYLEEWVMERDRQGHDPRFTQAESPPPLDVYQFIWDRTRMVRKDFVLQHYVGTGGNCDARAVRCHERIARWHAMCEHQLSHIPDFVSMQSQQNIQELGQTMKTLNQYYDDSLGRSTAEVEDKSGGPEVHGCRSPVVLGNSPQDFDGSALDNKRAGPNRLIGSNASKLPSRGTAEPEMRGLYILLTMDNDGGSEVLSYAARLFRERPLVYNSEPVQLALRIFKAKKDYNYARFFSILRSPSTPYLFACIMFKYVQQMRRAAFRIMSKTYGAKKKDTGEALYDLYPLKHLVRLLCFEDMEEALKACKHYNVTVQKMEASSGKFVAVVRWRHSDFRESKDPVKGTVLPIKPRKMVRTIEGKLKGATRLAVCRGDASGEEASLSGLRDALPAPQSNVIARQLSPAELETRKKEEETARSAALEAEKQKEEILRAERARRQADQERRQKEEQERREKELKHRTQIEKEKAEEAHRQEMLRKKEREVELQRKRQEEEERRKREAEESRRAEMAAAAEHRRRQQEEAERIAAEQEAARKKAEDEERERQHQLALRLKREEEERLMRIRMEEEARKKRAEEEKRIRILQIQRQREEEARKKQEEMERKIALEWEKKINEARKLLFWRRWRLRAARHLQTELSRDALSCIDPTYSFGPSLTKSVVEGMFNNRDYVESCDLAVEPELDIRAFFRRRKRCEAERLDLAKLLRKSMEKTIDGWRRLATKGMRSTVLCKVAVVLPESVTPDDERLHELIHEWFDSKLRYGKIMTDRWDPPNNSSCQVDLRTVVVNGNAVDANESSDASLFVIPPRPLVEGAKGYVFFNSAKIVHRDTPTIILNLDEESDPEYARAVRYGLAEIEGNGESSAVVTLSASGDVAPRLDTALELSCSALLEAYSLSYPERLPLLDRIALPRLARLCIRDALWTAGYNLRAQPDKHVLVVARATLVSLVDELNSFGLGLQRNHVWNWPSTEFADERNLHVEDYFNSHEHLPLGWRENLFRDFTEPLLMGVRSSLNGSFRYVIENLLSRAPLDVRNKFEVMIDAKQFRRCLESALLWNELYELSDQRLKKDVHVYIPRGNVENIKEVVINRLRANIDVDERIEDLPKLCYPQRSNRQGLNATTNGLDLHSDALSQNVSTMSDEAFVKETPALQSPVQDRSLGNVNALDIFGLNGDLPPFERGAGEFDGVETPDQSILSLKKSKRSLDPPVDGLDVESRGNKRYRTGDPNQSKDQQASQSFTQKLESLLRGTTTFDIDIGDSKLSDLLGRDVPPIKLP